MKKILMIAPASFPVFGAEAIVNIKLIETLSKSGDFEIDLVSKRAKWQDYPSDSFDDLNLKINSISIIEVDNTLSIKALWLHIKSLFIFKSVFKGSHWAVKALPVIQKLAEQNKYDYVLTRNSPSLLLGLYMKKKYNTKWIATWNDPYPVEKYPLPYGRGKEANLSLWDRIQLGVMRQADIHIFPSCRLRDYMLSYLHINKDCAKVVPHVVSDDKIESKDMQNHSSVIRFIHSGNLLPPRSPKTLINAINETDEKIIKDIKISIIGALQKSDFCEIKDNGKVFECYAPVSYTESLSLLNKYDIAIIIEADCDEGIFLPTKVSDFMQKRIPIWAISPKNGVLNDLYREGYIPYFSDIADVESIKRTLSVIYADFKKGHIHNNIVPVEYMANSIINQYKNF